MLSVLSTLRETLFVWIRNFWILTVITLFFGLFEITCVFWEDSIRKDPSLPKSYFALLTLPLLIVVVLLNSMRTAAILGLLTKPENEPASFRTIFRTIRDYSWTLFRLEVLIGLYVGLGCGLLGIVVTSVFRFLDITPGHMVFLILSAFYLMLVKYALANPLVVLDGWNARGALRQSWEMTRGHFWYVAGCYLILGGTFWLIRWSLAEPSGSVREGLWMFSFSRLMTQFLEPIWVLLGLCLYRQIRLADTGIEASVL